MTSQLCKHACVESRLCQAPYYSLHGSHRDAICGELRPCPIHDEPPPASEPGGDRTSAVAQHEGPSSPAALLSGPREASRGPTSRSPTFTQPPGGYHFSKRDLIEALVHPLTETVWVAVNHDSRASADLLDEIAEKIHEAAESDRNRAKRLAREKKR